MVIILLQVIGGIMSESNPFIYLINKVLTGTLVPIRRLLRLSKKRMTGSNSPDIHSNQSGSGTPIVRGQSPKNKKKQNRPQIKNEQQESFETDQDNEEYVGDVSETGPMPLNTALQKKIVKIVQKRKKKVYQSSPHPLRKTSCLVHNDVPSTSKPIHF